MVVLIPKGTAIHLRVEALFPSRNCDPSVVPPSGEIQAESVDASTAAGKPEKATPAAKPVNEDVVSMPSALATGVHTKSSKYLHGEECCNSAQGLM